MNLNQLEEQYNPNHDVPEGVQVTWADYQLLLAVKELQARIAVLEADKQQEARQDDNSSRV